MKSDDRSKDVSDAIADIFDGDPDANNFEVLGAFILLAESQDWEYDHFPDQGIVSLEVPTTISPCRIVVGYEPDKDSLTVASVYTLATPPVDLLRLYICLNECNDNKLRRSVGTFSYVPAHQAIRWQSTQCLVEVPGISIGWALALLQDCARTMLAAQPKFAALGLVGGTSLSADALYRLLHEPVRGRA